MHHRIMVRRERESKSEIAGFGGFNLPFPAISNRLESEKETPAQSLRTLFTDDEVGLIRRAAVKARVWTSAIVKVDVSADRGAGVGHAVVGPQVDLLVFDAAP